MLLLNHSQLNFQNKICALIIKSVGIGCLTFGHVATLHKKLCKILLKCRVIDPSGKNRYVNSDRSYVKKAL